MQSDSASSKRAILDRLHRITRSGDFRDLEDLLHPDFVQVIPQSGERVVGVENYRAIMENYPGMVHGIRIAEDPYIAGAGEHYMVTPTFNVVKLEDQGDELTSYVKATYPDGSEWYIVSLTTFKDGKILKRVDFFAPFFEAPAWRSQWVRTD